jgi:hypothetical protein
MMRNAGFRPERVRVDVIPLQTFVAPTPDNPAGHWVPGRFSLTAFAASVAAS